MEQFFVLKRLIYKSVQKNDNNSIFGLLNEHLKKMLLNTLKWIKKDNNLHISMKF